MNDILKEVINNDIIINIDTSRNTVHLKENSAESKLKGLYLTNLSEESFCFSLDNKKIPNICNGISKSAKYVNKCTDGILLTKVDSKFYCIICELKSNSPNRTEFTNQMKGSKLFINYLLSLIKEFYEIDIEVKQYINILFTTKSLSKSTISRRKNIVKEFNNVKYYEDKCRAGNTHSTFNIKKYLDT